MIFVDASALTAILLTEVDAEALSMAIYGDRSRRTSALAVYETVLAVFRVRGGDLATARADVEDFLARSKIEVVSIGLAEQEAALDAFERYGKGRHPAKLNMGDCFAYACARTRGARLLYKGDDFSQTDIRSA